MNLVGFLIVLLILVLVVGILWWLIDAIVPDPKIKQIARAILALIAVIYLLGALFGGVPLPAINFK